MVEAQERCRRHVDRVKAAHDLAVMGRRGGKLRTSKDDEHLKVLEDEARRWTYQARQLHNGCNVKRRELEAKIDGR